MCLYFIYQDDAFLLIDASEVIFCLHLQNQICDDIKNRSETVGHFREFESLSFRMNPKAVILIVEFQLQFFVLVDLL